MNEVRPENPSQRRLAYMPVSLFAIVMGLAGTTIAVQRAEQLYAWALKPGQFLMLLTVLVYLLIAAAYLTKFVRHRQHVIDEFNHPIRMSFFPAMSIGMILLSVAILRASPGVALFLWGVGSGVQLLFTLVILSNWIHHEKFQVQHSNPAWFIPIVGNILVPVAGVPLGFREISWFYFSVGLTMWIPLLAVLLNRFFFHPMLPGKLLPTLFILIAPPAVGFIAWVKLHDGNVDDVARILYYFALFTTLLLFSQIRYFARLAFALPWWAYSFPIAALTIATMVMQERLGGQFFALLALVLLALLIALMALLLYRTIRAMLRGEICVAE